MYGAFVLSKMLTLTLNRGTIMNEYDFFNLFTFAIIVIYVVAIVTVNWEFFWFDAVLSVVWLWCGAAFWR